MLAKAPPQGDDALDDEVGEEAKDDSPVEPGASKDEIHVKSSNVVLRKPTKIRGTIMPV